MLFLSMFLSINIYAQTGPGGIGNSDGSDGQPENVLWLDAESLSLSDGTSVNSWIDLSGNNSNAIQSNGTNQPVFKTGIMNSKPVIRFTGGQFLNLGQPANLDFTPGLDDFSVIAVYNPDGAGTILGKAYTGVSNMQYLFYTSGSIIYGIVGGQMSTNSTTYSNAQISNYLVNSSNINAWVNETKEITNGITGSVTNSVDVTIGASRNSWDNTGTQYSFTGDIAEIIVYNKELSNSERIIINNYLSAKYNINLSTNDYYTSTTFIEDVIGIGTTDGSDKFTETSGSGGGLLLEEANSTLNAANEWVFAGHDGTTNGVTTIELVDDIARWQRTWYIEKSTGSSIDVKIKFSTQDAGFGLPTNIDDYVLLYRSGTSGDYEQVTIDSKQIDTDNNVSFTVSNSNFSNGYYTLGVPKFKRWYTLISGEWDDWETWTLDPSGAIPNNPNHYTPSTSPTKELDEVYILSGKTITIDPLHADANNKSNALLYVEGRMEFGETTGHTFNEIKGSGRIVLASDNFPSGDASHFVTAGLGEGTVVYVDTDAPYNLSTARTYFNMEIDMNNATETNNVVTLLNNYTLNGDLKIIDGTLQISNTATNIINLIVNQNVDVLAAGSILVGSGDVYTANTQYHQFKVKGNFVNSGIVKLTNRTAANYTSYDTDGAVELIFNHATKNQVLECKNTTVLNQLTVDKGIDKTYILEVSATSTDNFKLYGKNDEYVYGDAGDRDGNKALRLLAGTLKLGSNIVIPSISTDSPFDIDTDARLWLSGSTVTMPAGSGTYDWFAIYGELKISNNSTFNGLGTVGILSRMTGVFNIEGGTANINNFRTSIWGLAGDHVGAYIQSGGTVNVVNEGVATTYAPFHLPYQTNVFQMSGGELHIQDQGNGGDADDFALVIACKDGNYNVTGGTVIIDMQYNVPYSITSRAPFYNFIVRNSVDADQTLTISDFDDTSGQLEDVPALPLVIYGDLTIEDNCTLDANGQNLEIIGDFNVNNGGTYTHSNGTLKFFGDGNSNINIGDNSAEPGLSIHKLEIEKNLNSNASVLDNVDIVSSGRTANTTALQVSDTILISRGELNLQDFNLSLLGDIEIANGNILYNTGRLVLNGSSLQTLTGSIIYTPNFGNVELNNAAGATIATNIEFDNFILTQGIMDINTNLMYVATNQIENGNAIAFGSSKMIQTSAAHGAKGLKPEIGFYS